jgi:hypothetical protein
MAIARKIRDLREGLSADRLKLYPACYESSHQLKKPAWHRYRKRLTSRGRMVASNFRGGDPWRLLGMMRLDRPKEGEILNAQALDSLAA